MNRSEINSITNFFYDNSDYRIRDKLFMGSPYALIAAYSCYVIFIVKILPKIMENRNPLDYRKFMSFVDVILLLRSCYFLYYASYLHFFVYNWKCQPLDQSDSWLSDMEIQLSYSFVITKFIYVLQSVVLVTCKRNNSVATYILIHHSTFPLILWIGANYYPGGHAFFIGLINSFVHVTGATMRIISAIYHKSSFVRFAKKIDIGMHIFQFAAIVGHGLSVLVQRNCNVPRGIAYHEIISALYIAAIYNKYVLNSKKRMKKD